MKQKTLVFPIQDGQILLGIKKRDFGEGKLNGFGGGQEEGETIEQTAVRELKEEVGLIARISDLDKVAEIDFFFPEVNNTWNQRVHIYLLRNWQGIPRESDEMGFEYHALNNIPYAKMWSSDAYWLPRVLQGEKFIAEITFNGRGESVRKFEIKKNLKA